MSRKHRATDHRAIVLESVATSPAAASIDTIKADAAAIGWTHNNQISAMVSNLLHIGLLGRSESGLFVTKLGMEWLLTGRFDRALPAPYTKPKRKRKQQQ